MSEIPTVDLAAVKTGQQAAWASGDYAQVGNRLVLVSELLCEAVDLHGGEKVLDVATGSGNAALAAARRFADVVGIDFVPSMLVKARARAAVDGLDVDFRDGDAEAIPFFDESFDVVLSACGAMFAPDHEKVASELLRVCRRGGRIGMVNWTPEGFNGELFRTMGKYLPPPPAGVRSAQLWGTHEHLRQLFGPDVEIAAPRKTFMFRGPSPEGLVRLLTETYGPTVKALQAIGPDAAEALTAEMTDVVKRFNVSGDDSVVMEQHYLEVVVRKP